MDRSPAGDTVATDVPPEKEFERTPMTLDVAEALS